MISVITAVYNQLSVNQLYWEYLKRFTHYDFELIIIDNGSTDGSPEFFESVGATVIRNRANYSYPYCQNRGIEYARFNYLAFLNNDVIVSPEWDLRLIKNMQKNDLQVVTPCGIENLENKNATKKLKNRWKIFRNLLKVFGHSQFNLRLTHKLMYGDYERFCNERHALFEGMTKDGFVGCAIFMRRDAIDKIGLWDERIQPADHDIYLRTIKRSIEKNDIKPMKICLDVFVHHYIRITLHSRPPDFADRDRLIPLEQKWNKEFLKHLEHIND